MRICRMWVEYCSSDEWGNETMEKIARERFEKDATLDCVQVIEHAGWFLSWNRAFNVIETANDTARMSDAARTWCKQFDCIRIVGINRRGEYADHYYPNYYPALAQVGAA